MAWLGTSIDKAVGLDSAEDVFRHQRDRYKAYHVICQSNHHGNFLEVSDFDTRFRQGVNCIPEGEA
jgi:hypothetical protein